MHVVARAVEDVVMWELALLVGFAPRGALHVAFVSS